LPCGHRAGFPAPPFFIHGNRDFLLGADALRDAGMQALPDPCPVDLLGQRLLLDHGDALCLSDAPYQAFRRMVPRPSWQQMFLAEPLAEREAMALRVRSESQGRKTAQTDLSAWADVDEAQARLCLQAQQATTLVHGHTHRPGVYGLGLGLTRRVLPIDFDAGQQRGHVVRLDEEGWHTLPVPAWA